MIPTMEPSINPCSHLLTQPQTWETDMIVVEGLDKPPSRQVLFMFYVWVGSEAGLDVVVRTVGWALA